MTGTHADASGEQARYGCAHCPAVLQHLPFLHDTVPRPV